MVICVGCSIPATGAYAVMTEHQDKHKEARHQARNMAIMAMLLIATHLLDFTVSEISLAGLKLKLGSVVVIRGILALIFFHTAIILFDYSTRHAPENLGLKRQRARIRGHLFMAKRSQKKNPRITLTNVKQISRANLFINKIVMRMQDLFLAALLIAAIYFGVGDAFRFLRYLVLVLLG
jgi:hypothetical protein